MPIDFRIKPKACKVIFLDYALGVPEGNYRRITSKSGLALNYGIDVKAGVVDRGYRGNVGVMPCVAVNRGATLLFMGTASRVCDGSVVLVPEVLNNIQLASNAFRLCSTTKQWCCYTAAPTYTVLKMNIMNKLKLYSVRFVRWG